jgi:hypothetical protein
MAESKKIVGFKKFSDIKSSSSKIEEVDTSLDLTPDTDSDLPMNPNLSSDSKKIERLASRKNVIPKNQNIDLDNDWYDDKEDEVKEDEVTEKKVQTYGRVAKFPKSVKASNAFNFLENVKISKKSIWYIMVESQDNELQMVKYNHKEGVDLSKFVNELKSYYINKNKGNKAIYEAVSKIGVDGNDKYSKITNISKIKIDNKLLITKITEDLIKLLSK